MRWNARGLLMTLAIVGGSRASAQVVTKTPPAKPGTASDTTQSPAPAKAPPASKAPAGGVGQSTPQGRAVPPGPGQSTPQGRAVPPGPGQSTPQARVVPNGPGTSTPLGRAAAAASATVSKAGLSAAVLALAKERDANPQNAGTNRALGIALYKLSKYDEAQPLLDKARQLDPTDGVSALYAGLTAEQLKDYPAARAAYNDYIRNGKTDKVRADIQSRLILIAKLELKSLAKDAVANEKRIGQVLSDPNTVAVLPLRFTGPDATLAPLERRRARTRQEWSH